MQPSLVPIALALALTGGGVLLYFLFKKDDDQYEPSVSTSRQIVIDVNIPKELIGAMIGRGGSKIKQLQTETGTRITFKDECSDETHRVCSIRGTPEAAQMAECKIHEFVMEQPLIVSEEMWVPRRAIGRIIGRQGDTITGITQNSGARIKVESSSINSNQRITMKGTPEQIAVARSLIEDKVKEDVELRQKAEHASANRSPRREPNYNLNYLTAPLGDQAESEPVQEVEQLCSSGGDGSLEVFVSALSSPDKFWVQLLSPRGVLLDQLEETMTEYYNQPENKELHIIRELVKGQIVAAPFNNEDKWFRAEVLSFKEDDYDPSESRVEVYYVDYGDTSVLKRSQILELRTDYLTLHFQAIECFLANIKPLGGEWSDEAIDVFEDLAQVAQWRKKLVRVVTYRDGSHKRGNRAGSPVPGVDLFDTSGAETLNIGDKLVKEGFAVREADVSNSPQDLVSSVPNRPISPSSMQSPSTSLSTGLNSERSNFSTSSSFIQAESGQALPVQNTTPEQRHSAGAPERGAFANNGLPGGYRNNVRSSRGVLPEMPSDDEDEEGFTMG